MSDSLCSLEIDSSKRRIGLDLPLDWPAIGELVRFFHFVFFSPEVVGRPTGRDRALRLLHYYIRINLIN